MKISNSFVCRSDVIFQIFKEILSFLNLLNHAFDLKLFLNIIFAITSRAETNVLVLLLLQRHTKHNYQQDRDVCFLRFKKHSSTNWFLAL